MASTADLDQMDRWQTPATLRKATLRSELVQLADHIDVAYQQQERLMEAARAAVSALDHYGAASAKHGLHRAWKGLVDALADMKGEAK